jgi:hypothetical protein
MRPQAPILIERGPSGLRQVAGTRRQVSAAMARHDPTLVHAQETPFAERAEVIDQEVEETVGGIHRAVSMPFLRQGEQPDVGVREPVIPRVTDGGGRL